MNKIFLFIIIYLIIGYILAKQRVCKAMPVVVPNAPPCKISFMDVLNAPVAFIGDAVTGFFPPKSNPNAAPLPPITVTDATGTYSSFGGKCFRKTADSVDAIAVDNSECTNRGIQII